MDEYRNRVAKHHAKVVAELQNQLGNISLPLPVYCGCKKFHKTEIVIY